MPILPENKKRYPKDWKEISRRIRFERAGNCCENCGVENHKLIIRGIWYGVECYQDDDGNIFDADTSEEIGDSYVGDVCDNAKVIRVVLTTAHLDHNPENNDERNLKALCQRCHNRYDAVHRKGTRRSGRMKNQLSIQFIQHEL